MTWEDPKNRRGRLELTFEEQQKLTKGIELGPRIVAGARWFIFIAGLSLINIIIDFFDFGVGFVFGLGATSVAAEWVMNNADRFGGSATAFWAAIAAELIITAVFVLLGKIAGRRYILAFLIGITLYALDALLFYSAGLWIELAFHAFVLIFLTIGLIDCIRFNRLGFDQLNG